MNQTESYEAAWYQALTVRERRDLLRARKGHADVNHDLAERRLRRWRSQYPFAGDELFGQRLAADGIDEHEFRLLLGQPAEAICDDCDAPPAWLAQVTQALADLEARSPGVPLPKEALPEQVQHTAGFLTVIGPLLRRGRERVREHAQALLRTRPDLPLDLGTVEALLFSGLPGTAITMLSRALVLELHVARMQGLLDGASSEERFQHFVERLRRPDVARAFLREYPVLARQVAQLIDLWVAFGLEFLDHLCADWDALRSAFGLGSEPDVLVRLDMGAGDRHRGGRSVVIAGFRSGFRVVYKPKSMATDAHFQELLGWLNQRGADPPFRAIRVLDRGSYGWSEFVEAASCATPDQVRRFYERQGEYLALLYVLEATDFHSENLIAAGEHPILIDLEALFRAYTHRAAGRRGGSPGARTLDQSVLCTGLLPWRTGANHQSLGIDLSGLGAQAGQLTPYPVPRWEGKGTDAMRFIRQRTEMTGTLNRPSLRGVEIDVLDYSEAISQGFAHMYRLLLRHRDELLAEGGQLACFAEDEVRAILRPTRTYAMLLYESFHPDVLRDGLDRDRLFDRLWTAIEQHPEFERAIPAEREDLLRGDIPLFTARPNSRHIWSSAGVQISDFYDRSGMEQVRRRVGQLSGDDLEKQLWFIRAALTTLAMGESHGVKPAARPSGPPAAPTRERLLAAARAVGDRLELLALRDEDDIDWVGVTLVNQRQWSLAQVGFGLYDGLSGIALFLAYLGAITHEQRYTGLARTAAAALCRDLEAIRSFSKSIGGFSGLGGIIYALAHLGVLWDQSELLDEAEALVEQLPSLIGQDETFDILGGAAGCIAGLLSLYRCRPSKRILEVALQCGDHLIAGARPMANGIGWSVHATQAQPLAGFSHGAAGIGWALLELAALSGETRFRAAADAAIAYERSLFSAERGNWLDLRDLTAEGQADNNGQERFLTAWCHGAPGIGLARLRMLQHLDGPEIRAEIDVALRTTLAEGFGANHSLCHGDLGNLELLLEAGQVLDDPQLRAQFKGRLVGILAGIEQGGWLCGVPLGVETPGLMTGLAGIGYGLLRAAEPRRVPSVLVLDPPVQVGVAV